LFPSLGTIVLILIFFFFFRLLLVCALWICIGLLIVMVFSEKHYVDLLSVLIHVHRLRRVMLVVVGIIIVAFYRLIDLLAGFRHIRTIQVIPSIDSVMLCHGWRILNNQLLLLLLVQLIIILPLIDFVS